MKNFIISSALLAIASATGSDTTTTNVYENKIIDFDDAWFFRVKLRLSLDLEYGTTYNAIQNSGWNKISYGTRTQAYVWFGIVFELFEWYWLEERLTFDLFNIEPIEYIQYYTSNYELVNGNYGCSLFNYNLAVLRIYVRHFENMKVCKSTLVEMIDVGDWVAPYCCYEDTNEGTWINGMWIYDPIGTFAPLTDIWYGHQNIYTICYY